MGSMFSKLLGIVETTEENEYNQVISQSNSWELMYHLSDLRKNVIEWIQINNDETVLEIGAECGALTTYLADSAHHVTCLEESEEMMKVNQARHSNYINISYVHGNVVENITQIKEKYDMITIIGGTLKLNLELLQKISCLIKPKGKLIIAMNNKFGLKYWAGCQDKEYSYYEWMEDERKSYSSRFMSKNELEYLVAESHIGAYEFYYPYPDYCYAMAIYSDDYLPKRNELKASMRNFDKERMVLFDEEKVFNAILDAQLFQQYSNSFLVIIEKES